MCCCTVTDNNLRNVAKLKPSIPASTYSDQHLAGYANDGNGQTCAASKPETNPWWAVDLGGPTLVFMVKLTNEGNGKGRLLVSIDVMVTFSKMDPDWCFLQVSLLCSLAKSLPFVIACKNTY